MDLLIKFFQMIVNEVKGKRANIFLKIYYETIVSYIYEIVSYIYIYIYIEQSYGL